MAQKYASQVINRYRESDIQGYPLKQNTVESEPIPLASRSRLSAYTVYISMRSCRKRPDVGFAH